jgi:hypothetical protein
LSSFKNLKHRLEDSILNVDYGKLRERRSSAPQQPYSLRKAC